MDALGQGLRLDATVGLVPSNHATAGEAAMGLVQMTEAESHGIAPSEEILESAKTLDLFAQKAELTQKVLEQYLFGTDITRVGPVYVPVTPSVINEYPVPVQDISTFKAEHLPYDPQSPFTGIKKLAMGQGLLVFQADFSSRPRKINDFI
jgi:hypothetical protein